MGTSRGGLASALFTVTQQRVLGLLFGQPERRFGTTELIHLAGGGRGAVQRELQRLVKGGLATVRSEGGRRIVQANAAAPIYSELRHIVEKTLGPAPVLAGAIAALAPRIDWAILFGSVAQGTDTARSDFDLLLVGDGLTLEEVFEALRPAEAALGRTVNPLLLTRAEFRKRRRARQPFLTKILTRPYVVLHGDERAVAA